MYIFFVCLDLLWFFFVCHVRSIWSRRSRVFVALVMRFGQLFQRGRPECRQLGRGGHVLELVVPNDAPPVAGRRGQGWVKRGWHICTPEQVVVDDLGMGIDGVKHPLVHSVPGVAPVMRFCRRRARLGGPGQVFMSRLLVQAPV